MIHDILEVFKKEYKEKGDKLILDKYILKDGLYLKINQDKSLEYYIFKNDKKESNKSKCFKDIAGNMNHEMYTWFKEKDYYSSVLDNAKVFDAPKKIIHNNNYLTLFMKIEKFLDLNISHIEDKLYKKVLSYKDFDSKNEKNILKNYCPKIKLLRRKKDIINKYKIVRSIFEHLKDVSREYPAKTYLKLFFDEDISKYQEESEIYFALKIFNDNKYSIDIDGVAYGLSNSNMGLNSKKPYLEGKTKKLSTPFMITNADARLTKVFFDWLYLQDYKNTYLLHENIFITKYPDNGQAVINDFDYIPVKINKLEKPIVIKNHLILKKGKLLIEDETIEYLNILEDKIDDVLYNRQLKNNYYGEVYKKLDNRFASFIYSTRDAMVGYFKKYDDRAFYQIVEKYATHLAIEHVVRGRFLKAGECLNIKFSLKQKGADIMDIKEMQVKIIDKIKDSDYDGLSNEEFFYLCGQMARYLVSQSERKDKKGDMLEAYLRANSTNKLKRVIETEYFRYKHAISLGYTKFNNAMSLIMSYDNNEKLSLSKNMDNFLVGALSENIFYMKREG